MRKQLNRNFEQSIILSDPIETITDFGYSYEIFQNRSI